MDIYGLTSLRVSIAWVVRSIWWKFHVNSTLRKIFKAKNGGNFTHCICIWTLLWHREQVRCPLCDCGVVIPFLSYCPMCLSWNFIFLIHTFIFTSNNWLSGCIWNKCYVDTVEMTNWLWLVWSNHDVSVITTNPVLLRMQSEHLQTIHRK